MTFIFFLTIISLLLKCDHTGLRAPRNSTNWWSFDPYGLKYIASEFNYYLLKISESYRFIPIFCYINDVSNLQHIRAVSSVGRASP